MKRPLFPLVLLVLLSTSCSNQPEPVEYRLYYLGGQSNMDGYGMVAELPDSLSGPVNGAMIFHGNTAPDRASTSTIIFLPHSDTPQRTRI